jgi:hypothetical protein
MTVNSLCGIPEKSGTAARLTINRIKKEMAMTNMRSVGIDIGAQKTIIVSDDGERILTSTGSMTRPTLVLFSKLTSWRLLISANLIIDR